MGTTARHTKQHTKNVSKHERNERRNRENGGSGGGGEGGSGGRGGSGGGGSGVKEKDSEKKNENENRNGKGEEKEKEMERGKEGGEVKNDVTVHHIPVHHKHPHAHTHTNNTHTNHTHTGMRKFQSAKTHTDTSHLRSLFYHNNKTRHENINKHENNHESKIENKNENYENINSSKYSVGTYGNSTVNGTWVLRPNVSTDNMLDSTIQNSLKYLDIEMQHRNRVFMWHKNTEMTPFDKRIQSAAQLGHIKVITEEMEGTVLLCNCIIVLLFSCYIVQLYYCAIILLYYHIIT